MNRKCDKPYRRTFRFIAGFAMTGCLLAFPAPLFADNVYLKNGNVLEGVVEEEGPDTIRLNLGFGFIMVSKNEIDKITKSTSQESQKLQEQWVQRKKEEDLRRPEEERKKAEDKAKWERLQEESERMKESEYAPKEVGVSTENGHFFVYARLNGKTRVKLLFDSGATFVTLSKRIAEKLEIDVDQLKKAQVSVADGRSVEVAKSQLESVEILSAETENPADLKPTGIKIPNVEVLFLTRAKDFIIKAPNKVYVPDDGLLGVSFLKYFQLKLDYPNRKIMFQKNRGPAARDR